jgi:hypothetical protein
MNRTAWIAAGGSALLAGLAALGGADVFASYLWALRYWQGLGLGCLGLLMLQHLTGGAWAAETRPALEAGALTLGPFALLLLPLFAGLEALFPWARHELHGAGSAFAVAYRTVPLLAARTAAFAVLWAVLALLASRPAGDPDARRRRRRLSAGGLVALTFTVFLFAADWEVALEAGWGSSLYGLLVLAGDGLGALALVAAARLRAGPVPADRLRDLGNLMLAFLLVWAYLSYSQLLIIWYANLPHEAAWYVRRATPGGRGLAALLLAFHLAVPLLLLLSRAVKESGRGLLLVAAGLLAARLAEVYWRIVPSARRGDVAPSWTDVAAWAGLGGIWVAAFLTALRRRPAPEELPSVEAVDE